MSTTLQHLRGAARKPQLEQSSKAEAVHFQGKFAPSPDPMLVAGKKYPGRRFHEIYDKQCVHILVSGQIHDNCFRILHACDEHYPTHTKCRRNSVYPDFPGVTRRHILAKKEATFLLRHASYRDPVVTNLAWAIADVLSPDTSAVGNGNGTCIIPHIGKCTNFVHGGWALRRLDE